MEQLISVAKQLRQIHKFGGYIHLKAIPGADPALLEQAGLFADRLSANIELPTQQDLVQLAPEKKSAVIESTMSQIAVRKDEADEERKRTSLAPKFAAAGQSTQMVVGATPATDRQILSTATHLYGEYKLRRIYYTGFSPYPEADARLPLRAAPLIREHRLYQSDWLMRFYGFEASELTSEAEPELSLTEDPKTTWARTHPEFFPLDVNRAPRESLLRIPGIGYRNVERILKIRRYHPLTLEDLRKLNVRTKSALPYLITTDHLPTAPRPLAALADPAATQLDLFAPLSALTGSI
jgi:predicted DNA-binding helix-hairpin-helix protein